MKQRRIDPGGAWAKRLNISAGVKIGDTIYLSGTVAFDSDGNVIGAGDMYAQAKQTFKNIEEALESAGAKMEDVVKITTFLTDMSGYREFGRARTEAFPKGVPASAAYATPALIKPELLVEVEAIAVVGSGN
jgi:enamine deaminase RidA (YjgF/YER057c/UK114 family)